MIPLPLYRLSKYYMKDRSSIITDGYVFEIGILTDLGDKETLLPVYDTLLKLDPNNAKIWIMIKRLYYLNWTDMMNH